MIDLLTGLPRFDELFRNKDMANKENIFLYATWRPWFKRNFLNLVKRNYRISTIRLL